MTGILSHHQHQIRLLRASQSRLGRSYLKLALMLKRLTWISLVNGGNFLKRGLDVLIASVALILAAPLFILIAFLVRLDGGPVFFRQSRVGYMGREFGMLKFRSMCVNAEAKLAGLLAVNEMAQGITFKMRNDPRVTRVGRFIRKASMDELPQLINVLAGDMSIVGPRPPLPREVALYSVEDRRRLTAKPGITCLWQVGERNGGTFEIGDRNSIDFDEQVRLDVRYIEEQTAAKDLWIMVKTLPAMLLGK